MINLYPYQEDLIEALRQSFAEGNRKIVLCAPTGAGKTIMFTYMVQQHIKRNGKALILTDRINLLKQADGAFSKFGISPELITAGSTPNLEGNCHVAMIETLHRRAKKYSEFLLSRKLIIVDEAHKTAFEKIFPYLSDDCLVIGATATPYRSGQKSSMDEYYTDIIQDIDTMDLIQLGNLSDCKAFGIDVDLSQITKRSGDYDAIKMGMMYNDNKVYEGVISNYKRLTPNTKAICFASSIQSAERLEKEMNAKGIACGLIHSKKTDEANQNIIKLFLDARPGTQIVLINVGILTTGFDCPTIETVILYRATTSLSLYLQMIGRGSRITPNKKEFTLLDFGNNVKTHNFWEAPRTWSLQKKKRGLGVAPIKSCPMCNAFLPSSAKKCKYCDHEFKETEEEKKLNEYVKLKELPKHEINEIARGKSLEEKADMAKAKLINAFWVLHQITDIEEARKFIKLMKWSPKFEYVNRDRFKVFGR